MKKILAVMFCAILAACGNYIDNENGSEFLVQLDEKPVGCTYLHKLEAEVSVYEQDDARRYLENRIVAQPVPGNAYWITSQRTRPNEGVIFGPERTFILLANVYDCPNARKIQTENGVKSAPSTPAEMYGGTY